MMPRQSIAEKHRRHRREMKLALRLKCTPGEARKVIERSQARKQWRATQARIAARQRQIEAAQAAPCAQGCRDRSSQPWMMRE